MYPPALSLGRIFLISIDTGTMILRSRAARSVELILRFELTCHKLLALKTLRVKQRGEGPVVDPHGGSCRDRRLGVEGDAQSRLANHAEIIGAVAHDQRIDVVEVGGLAKLDERGELGGAAENGFFDLAHQLSVARDQFVAAVFLKAD